MARIAFLACALLVLAVAPAGAAPEAKRVTFEDQRGENPGGLDVMRVTVSNDDAGRLTFQAAIPSNPRLEAGMRFRLWIDSDASRATGLQLNGMDFFVLHEAGRTGLYRCGPTSCRGSATARTLRFAYAAGPRFRILDAEVGSPKRLRFAIEAATGIFVDPATKTVDASNAQFDDAPQRGRAWTYRPALVTP